MDLKKYKEKRVKELELEIARLKDQQMALQQQLSQLPLQIASRQGEIIGLNKLTKEQEEEKASNKVKNKESDK